MEEMYGRVWGEERTGRRTVIKLQSWGGLNMLGPGSGTIRKCDLVGGSVSYYGGEL